MNHGTDILHEAKRLRLLAAALELQHFTSTAASIMPIPGGDRVIAIGTPAQVRALLGAADHAQKVECGDCCGTGSGEFGAGSCTTCYGKGYDWEPIEAPPAVDAAAICDGVVAKSKNSLFRSGAKICAGEIRAAQAGADQVDSEGGHHD